MKQFVLAAMLYVCSALFALAVKTSYDKI